MAEYAVITGGYRVSWAPTFATRAEAEAWIAGDHDWEERTEALLLSDDYESWCDECRKLDVLESYPFTTETRWLCEACKPR